MSGSGLRAVVIGAGWAGEGHTVALRHNGVEVVAICARQPDAVGAVASCLDVPEASTDWLRTLERVKPDIVTLATPASLRGPVVEAAAGLGCHVLCEKPLAASADEARRLYDLVRAAGIKHAYAATARYDPSIVWMAELVRDGAIGELREIDWTFRLPQPLPTLSPWTWMDSIAAGGGWLNNVLTHGLGVFERITGRPALKAMGESRTLRHRAPVVPGIHDARQRITKIPTPEEAAHLEWRECDAEEAASVILRFASASPDGLEVQVTCVLSALAPATWPPNGMRLYGEEGTLLATGAATFEITRQRPPDTEPEPMPIPGRVTEALPQIDGILERRWAALARDLLADIQCQPHSPYLTFYDGWRYQEAIDAIRDGRSWFEIPPRG